MEQTKKQIDSKNIIMGCHTIVLFFLETKIDSKLLIKMINSYVG